MHVTGPQMHGFYRSILYSHHNFGNIQKFRQSRSFFFFYFLFLCLSFSDQGTGAFLILNKSSDVRELQQAIGRSVGNDERPRCDGSGTVVRDPRVYAVRCAVLEAPAPSRLHPAGAGGWESRRVRVERATLDHQRACDVWQHSDQIHVSEKDEGHEDHDANDI